MPFPPRLTIFVARKKRRLFEFFYRKKTQFRIVATVIFS